MEAEKENSILFGIDVQHAEPPLSLDKRLGIKKPHVFEWQMQGDAMADRIEDGDWLVVNNKLTASNGDFVLIVYNGDFYCRQYFISNGRQSFKALNKRYLTITPNKGELIEIRGVIKHFTGHL